jgi:hypothetical protein
LDELPQQLASTTTQGAFAAALLGAPAAWNAAQPERQPAGAPPALPLPLGAPDAPPVWTHRVPLPGLAGSWPSADPWLQAPAAPAQPLPLTGASSPDLLSVVVSHIKLHDISPYELPRELSELVRTWLGPHVLDALAYVRPGCTLITVHALAPSGAPAEAHGSAAALAATLVARAPTRVARSRFAVYDAAGCVARAQDGAVADCGQAPAAQPTTPLPPLRPLALCSLAPGALASVAAAGASGVLRAYIGGALLPLPADAVAAAAGQPVKLQLAASGCVRCCEQTLAVRMR